MELIAEYLSQVFRVSGVYVLKIGEDATDELVHNIVVQWSALNPHETLIVIPDVMDLSYEHGFDWYTAMKLAHMGCKVRCEVWGQYSMSYINMNEHGRLQRVIGGSKANYVPEKVEMESSWYLVQGAEERGDGTQWSL